MRWIRTTHTCAHARVHTTEPAVMQWGRVAAWQCSVAAAAAVVVVVVVAVALYICVVVHLYLKHARLD